jgi:hypothetical protein
MAFPKSFFAALGAIALVVVLAPITYLLSGPFLDDRAKDHAEEMCNTIEVGIPVGSLTAIAKAHDIELLEWPPDKDGGIRYQFRLSGFLANGFTCEVYAENGKVRSRFTDEHTW